MGAVIEWLALQALAHKALGNTTQAMAALERAIVLAEPEGYVRVFVDEGEPMAQLLRLTADHRPPTAAYARKLLDAFSTASVDTNSISRVEIRDPKSEISERELEVLRLIAEGHSNQEIADRLVVALSTVKTHVNNLYSKLDVTNRVQAVSRAQELNLLRIANHTQIL